MSAMKFKRVAYRIHNRTKPDKSEVVQGYAVDCDSPLRFCVRSIGRGWWKVDQWETGASAGCFKGPKELAALEAQLYLKSKTPEQIDLAWRRALKELDDKFPLNPVAA